MNRQPLPPFDFVLTPDERSRIAVAKVQIEANRRRQNELDRLAPKAVGTKPETQFERLLRALTTRQL